MPNRQDPDDREHLGKLVRQLWIQWAREQPSPKPSWLVEWDELPESDREVDRRIGDGIAEELLRVWNEGRSDYCRGVDPDDNPYGYTLGKIWWLGWEHALKTGEDRRIEEVQS